jgi:pimeloyl-ACP methyl ester carboxylesterase
VPSVVLPSSPLAGGRPVTIGCRVQGDGPPLVFLHGGWGYEIYPIDIGAFASGHTVVIPDRSGYGRSSELDDFPPDFHHLAALETLAVLDSLGLEHATWWGHSDGAVIAAMAALHAPDRVRAVILEALHYSAVKPRSRSFFQRMATDPDSFGDAIRQTLAAEHGDVRWRHVLQLDGQAWLDIASAATTMDADLYQGRLHQLGVPTLVIHGGADPRSEAGELEAIMEEIPDAQLSLHVEAGHSPHSESSRHDVTYAVSAFLASLGPLKAERA